MSKKISAEEFLKKHGFETEEEKLEVERKRFREFKEKGEFPDYHKLYDDKDDEFREFRRKLAKIYHSETYYNYESDLHEKGEVYDEILFTPELMIKFYESYSDHLSCYYQISETGVSDNTFFLYFFLRDDISNMDNNKDEICAKFEFLGLFKFYSFERLNDYLDDYSFKFNSHDLGIDGIFQRNFISGNCNHFDCRNDIKKGDWKYLDPNDLRDVILNRLKGDLRDESINEALSSSYDQQEIDLIENKISRCVGVLKSIEKSSSINLNDKVECLAELSKYPEVPRVIKILFKSLETDVRGEIAIITATAISSIISQENVKIELLKRFKENKNSMLMGGQNPQNRILYVIALSKNPKLLEKLNPGDFSDNLSPEMENRRNNLIESAKKNYDLDGIAANLIWLEALDYAANKNVFIYASEIFPANSILLKKLVNRLN